MCKFCEAMETHRKVDTILKKNDPDWSQRYSVAIVSRSFCKGKKGARSTSTDYRYRGCGYALNFCPECGRPMNGPHKTGTLKHASIGKVMVDEEGNTASVTVQNNFRYD